MITTKELSNNESFVTGYQKTPSGYLALTPTQSKKLKTEKGAIAWLAKRGFNPDGTRKN